MTPGFLKEGEKEKVPFSCGFLYNRVMVTVWIKCSGFLALATVALATGCSGPFGSPIRVTLDTAGVAASTDTGELAVVLTRCLTSDGSIIPEALNNQRDKLNVQLKRFVVTGPSASPGLFADEDAAIAFWYNARTAWSLKLAMETAFPQEICPEQIRELYFPLDGKTMTLSQIDSILGKYAWQAQVAAPGACLDRAHLPKRPFTAGDVRGRIVKRLNSFINDPRRFVVDVQHKRVLVAPILWQHRQEIIDQYDSGYGTKGANLLTALIPHVSGSALRRIQDAIGYETVPMTEREFKLDLEKIEAATFGTLFGGEE
jgi:hypothetical protein